MRKNYPCANLNVEVEAVVVDENVEDAQGHAEGKQDKQDIIINVIDKLCDMSQNIYQKLLQILQKLPNTQWVTMPLEVETRNYFTIFTKRGF